MNCKDCGLELVKGINWYPSHELNRKYVCNHCFKKANSLKHPRTDALIKRKRSVAFREESIKLLGSKCAQCGFSDIRALCLDHVTGVAGQETEGLSETAVITRQF